MNAPTTFFTDQHAYQLVRQWYGRHRCDLLRRVMEKPEYEPYRAAILQALPDIETPTHLACEMLRREVPGFAHDICQIEQNANRAERLQLTKRAIITQR